MRPGSSCSRAWRVPFASMGIRPIGSVLVRLTSAGMRGLAMGVLWQALISGHRFTTDLDRSRLSSDLHQCDPALPLPAASRFQRGMAADRRQMFERQMSECRRSKFGKGWLRPRRYHAVALPLWHRAMAALLRAEATRPDRSRSTDHYRNFRRRVLRGRMGPGGPRGGQGVRAGGSADWPWRRKSASDLRRRPPRRSFLFTPLFARWSGSLGSVSRPPFHPTPIAAGTSLTRPAAPLRGRSRRRVGTRSGFRASVRSSECASAIPAARSSLPDEPGGHPCNCARPR